MSKLLGSLHSIYEESPSKRVCTSQSKSNISGAKMLDESMDLIDLKQENDKLRIELSQLQNNNKFTVWDLEKRIAELLQKNRKFADDLTSAQNEAKTAKNALKRLQTDLVIVEKENKLLKSECEQKVEKMASSTSILTNEHNVILSEQAMVIDELEAEKMEMRQSLSTMQSKYEEAKAQLSLLKRRTAELTATVAEVEKLRESEATLQRKLECCVSDLDRLADDRRLVAEMKDSLDSIGALRRDNERLSKENATLKLPHENIALLREKLSVAEGRAAQLESTRTKLGQADVRNEQLETRLARWAALAELGHCSTPEETRQTICQLRKDNALVSANKQYAQQGEWRGKCESLERRLAEVKARSLRCQEERDAARSEAESRQTERRRLKRVVHLLTLERDSLKSILAVAEATPDVTLNVAASTQSPDANRTRVRELEAIVDRQNAHIKESEEELTSVTEELTNLRERCVKLSSDRSESRGDIAVHSQHQPDSQTERQQVLELRQHIERLERELLATASRRDLLEMRFEQRLLQGEFDPLATKVLHLTENPFDEARRERLARHDALVAENADLRSRVELLQRNEGQLMELTMQVADNVSVKKELHDVRKELKRAELGRERIIDAFRAKSQEMRAAVYMLLGYEFNIPADRQYKLTSFYAESDSDCLLFQLDDENKMQFLENDYALTLAPSAELYLQRHNSIPAFLSSITMDLFNRQTFMT